MVKSLPVSAEDLGDLGVIPGLRASPGVGNGSILALGSPMDKESGGLQPMVSQRVGLKRLSMHASIH